MRNLNIHITNNWKVVHLDEPIILPTAMTLRHATLFWKYENVTSENNTILYGTKVVTFEPGYWDFETIRERLDSNNITLSRNVQDRTCNILSKTEPVNLRNLGLMLGFGKDEVVPADTKTKSSKSVDILKGLRYINVKCDAVDIRESTDSEGGRSSTLSSLPIVSDEALNSSATSYFNLNSTVDTYSGNISRLEFTVDSNLDEFVGVDVLLNIVVE